MTQILTIALQPPLDALFDTPPVELCTEAQTVLDALRQLCAGSARSQAQILHEGGLSPYVHVFLNGANVAGSAVAAQAVRDGDELCLLTAIRGG